MEIGPEDRHAIDHFAHEDALPIAIPYLPIRGRRKTGDNANVVSAAAEVFGQLSGVRADGGRLRKSSKPNTDIFMLVLNSEGLPGPDSLTPMEDPRG